MCSEIIARDYRFKNKTVLEWVTQKLNELSSVIILLTHHFCTKIMFTVLPKNDIYTCTCISLSSISFQNDTNRRYGAKSKEKTGKIQKTGQI